MTQDFTLDASYEEEAQNVQHCVINSQGKIVLVDRADRRHAAGTFRAHLIDVRRGQEYGFEPVELLQTLPRLASLEKALYDSDGVLSDAVHVSLDCPGRPGNVLLIEHVALLPKYRGAGLGLRVVRGLIQQLGSGADFVALDTTPLQHDQLDTPVPDHFRIGALPGSPLAAAKKLTAYFSRLGFVRVAHSSVLVRSLHQGTPPWPY